ncbi:hypothetical protein F2P56_033560 [Juglans regia]|uniref:Uncharacterized protein LOC109003319 n=2 Tax=Juglans regia TaxID=51240 RepID=A0A2I4FZ81_JUGRE|nr:uncharacterized protein LOC109003319 [Juglans regia]KAF5448056.1 hypothetical protein F2P56_033560 [Juglans regia]
MDAKLGGGPYFKWRSLWESRDVVREGMRWRVGNRKKIKIWVDKWMSTPSSYMVQSPVSTLGREATVAELIDENTGCWNYDLVRESFNKEEVAIFYTIPVSRMSLEDKLYWGPTKNELFSVKSAHYIAMEIIRQYGGEQSVRNGVNQLEETSGHVLWSCVTTSNKSELEGMAFIFKKVWQRSNWIFENSFQSPIEVIAATMTNREEYIQAKGADIFEISGSAPVNRNVSKCYLASSNIIPL